MWCPGRIWRFLFFFTISPNEHHSALVLRFSFESWEPTMWFQTNWSVDGHLRIIWVILKVIRIPLRVCAGSSENHVRIISGSSAYHPKVGEDFLSCKQYSIHLKAIWGSKECHLRVIPERLEVSWSSSKSHLRIIWGSSEDHLKVEWGLLSCGISSFPYPFCEFV